MASAPNVEGTVQRAYSVNFGIETLYITHFVHLRLHPINDLFLALFGKYHNLFFVLLE